MITDIPTADDFRLAGTAYLNLAWSSAIGLALQLDDSRVEAELPEDGLGDVYWKAAQTPLGVAMSLMQQGGELLLKAQIAAVSPFLLLANPPRDWPSHSYEKDTPFSDFKTLDAQDLVRVHGTVAARKLDESFLTHFGRSRRMRNILMHSVDKRIQLTAKSILLDVLRFYGSLVPNASWLACRREHLENNPDSVAFSSDYVGYQMCREFNKVLGIFSTAEMRTHFGVDKRQRFYMCQNCQVECEDCMEVDTKSAQLVPNTSQSTNLYCFICGYNSVVERRKCLFRGCLGNVIGEDDTCLTCGES